MKLGIVVSTGAVVSGVVVSGTVASSAAVTSSADVVSAAVVEGVVSCGSPLLEQAQSRNVIRTAASITERIFISKMYLP